MDTAVRISFCIGEFEYPSRCILEYLHVTDIAVGAPYEGSTFGGCTRSPITGAVYIFHGSKTGIRPTYSQIITASDMANVYQTNSLTTFGFSLSGGMDLDNNLYPDLVVGAYDSDTVFFFR